MDRLNALYQLVLADFRERTRRYSFLITLLGTLFFSYLVMTGKYTLRLGEYRGEYNSAWVGSLMGITSTIMLCFFGFYLVKNSLSRDRRTGVGQILATTLISNSAYVTTKFISNFIILGFMAAILAAVAVVTQWINHAADGFDLWALLAPFLFVCLPVLPLVAAMAVLFESVKWLRGTMGNILYLVIAEAAIMNSLVFDIPLLDFSGLGIFIPSMQDAAWATYPEAKLGVEIGFIGFIDSSAESTLKLFHWDGIAWSLGMVPLRLLWVAAAVGLTGLATVCFDRFDPALTGRAEPAPPAGPPLPAPEDPGDRDLAAPRWSGDVAVEFDFSFPRMLKAELRLMLKGYHWSWYAIALGLLAAQLALPYGYARAFALPAAWIWPLSIWSSMGTREARFNTGPILFSSAHPVSRQLPAVWVAGMAIALLTGSGMLLRAVLGGETAHLSAVLVGALFVPTLALALGTVSGTRKLFEMVYLLIWYIGPINRSVPLDFLGVTHEAATGTIPLLYLAISLALLPATFLVRRRQVALGRG